MTEEDKKLISEYMGWKLPCNGNVNHAAICAIEDGSLCVKCEFHHPFDSNDAALCVHEMQKRGEWEQFHDFVIEWGDLLSKASFAYITAWLMSMEEGQAKNFFKAFCEWRKGK